MNNQSISNLSDKELIEKVLHGDHLAFAVIVKKTESLVAMIVFKMINSQGDRKDLAQDIYLKAFHNLRRFRFQSKLSTWIGQIAYNTCLNYLDKKKLVLVETVHDEALFSDKNSENLVFNKELSAILKVQLENLSPLYRTLITLFHMEELSYAEIGEITSLPEGTIKSYLFRARKILKDQLLSQFKKEDL